MYTEIFGMYVWISVFVFVNSVVVWSMRSSMRGMLFRVCSSVLSVYMSSPNCLAVV